MKTNAYKLEYTQEEYVRRHLPHILRDLFIRLSDAFKDGAPARREHYIMINQCQNCGHLDINKLLECYALRDIRKTPKPFYRVNDIITISVLKFVCMIFTKCFLVFQNLVTFSFLYVGTGNFFLSLAQVCLD